MPSNYGGNDDDDVTRVPDTVRNPMFDQLMGFGEDSNDSGPMAFIKGLQSSLARNTPQGRELTADIAKSKLANQMQLQLMQQKLELEKQYPEYQVVNTPYGSNLLIDTRNPDNFHEINRQPGQKEEYEHGLLAKERKNAYESSDAYFEQKKEKDAADLALTKARTDESRRMAEYGPAKLDAVLNPKAPKPPAWSTLDDARTRAETLAAAGYDKDLDFDGSKARALEDVVKEAQRRGKAQRDTERGSAPANAPEELPDLSGLLDPNSLGQQQ